MGVIIVILLCVLCVILGLLALARNSKSSMNRAYAYFSLVVSVWMLANFFGSNYKDRPFSVQLIHADFLIGSFIPYMYFKLARAASIRNYAHGFLPVGKFATVILGLAVVAAVSTLFTPIVGIYHSDGRTVIEYGSLYALYGLLIFIQIIISVVIIFRAYRNSVGVSRARLSNLLFVTFFMLLLGFVANLIVPLLSDSLELNLLLGNISYLGITAFVTFSFYAIVREKFLNVRMATSRIVGYLLSVAALIIVTSLVVIEGFSRISSIDLGLLDVMLLSLFVIAVASGFNRLLRFFAVITNGIFRTNFYYIDDAITELNQKFVEETQVEGIIGESLEVLNKYIDGEFISIVTYLDSEPRVFIDGQFMDLNSKDLELVRSLPKSSSIVQLEHDVRFMGRGIDSCLALTKSTSEVEGYLIIGHKRNGGMYGKIDIQLIKIYANNLSLALANALNLEKVLQFNRVLRSEVKQATGSLRTTNTQLKVINKSKDEMMSMAAHQLRPQLTALRGFLDLLSQKEKNAKKIEMLNWSATGIERMIRIVTDMLNLSRVTSGEFKIFPSKVDLAMIIENELLSVEPLRRTRNTRLIKKSIPTKIYVQADEVKLREVIANLLTNSIEYSPIESGKVEVSLKPFENGYEFTVKDNGIGVEESEEDNLFQKYYRTSQASEVRPAGTGVGLFLAKKVIEAHGGRVFYRKPKNEQGSIFGFWLPVLEETKKTGTEKSLRT